MGWVNIFSFRRSFNIHGYWPSFNSSKNYGKLDIALFYGFADDLNRLWPARSETPKNPRHPTEEESNFLWNHEWSKHGKDFAELYSKLFGVLSKNPIGNNKLLQQSYFREVVNYVKTLGVKLTSRPANKAQLASQLGVPENSLIPRCLPSGNLQEVRVCTEMTKVGSRLQIRAVACTKSNSNCRGIQLAGFK